MPGSSQHSNNRSQSGMHPIDRTFVQILHSQGSWSSRCRNIFNLNSLKQQVLMPNFKHHTESLRIWGYSNQPVPQLNILFQHFHATKTSFRFFASADQASTISKRCATVAVTKITANSIEGDSYDIMTEMRTNEEKR